MSIKARDFIAGLPEEEQAKIMKESAKLLADHKARVRAAAKKMSFIHRAALKELADGATPPPPPASSPEEPEAHTAHV